LAKLKNWFQTYSGKLVSITNPKPEDIDIIDIAHALSMTCRFGGHCREFYSIAEHSIRVCEVGQFTCPINNDHPQAIAQALAFLLHDAAEAYIGDLITPLKSNLGGAHELETRWLRAIEQKYGLGTSLSEPSYDVKETDLRVLSFEVVKLFDCVDPTWWTKFKRPEQQDHFIINVQCWSPPRARREFLRLFNQLYGQLNH